MTALVCLWNKRPFIPPQNHDTIITPWQLILPSSFFSLVIWLHQLLVTSRGIFHCSSNLKNDRLISVRLQGKPFNIMVIQVYAPTSNDEEAEVEWFYEDLQDILELTPKKDVLFIIGDWNAKVGSQETPGVTGKFGFGIQNEAGQRLIVLPREHTSHSKHPLPMTQEKTLHMDITRWSTPKSDWLYSLQPKMEKALYSQQKQDQELTVAQIMNSLSTNSDLNWRK